MTWDARINCLKDNGYFDCEENDNACYTAAAEECMDEYYACFPPGDNSCKDMWVCYIECPTGDQACQQECLASGTQEAQGEWDTFIDCIDDEGYFDCAEGDSDCLNEAWSACNEEFTACAHGDFTCKEMSDCVDTCAPTDQVCIQVCLLNGSIEAQGTWDDMVTCLIEQCGEQDDPECENDAFQGACSSVYNACIGS